MHFVLVVRLWVRSTHQSRLLSPIQKQLIYAHFFILRSITRIFQSISVHFHSITHIMAAGPAGYCYCSTHSNLKIKF